MKKLKIFSIEVDRSYYQHILISFKRHELFRKESEVLQIDLLQFSISMMVITRFILF